VLRGQAVAEFKSVGYQKGKEEREGDDWTSGTFEFTVTFSESGIDRLQVFGSDAILTSYATVTITVTE
jgi:hypothetical protein